MKLKVLIGVFVCVLLLLTGCGGEPDKNVDTSEVNEGFVGYVVKIEGARMLVVSPDVKDYSSTGGMEKHYPAIWFSKFPSNIKVGMKVEVWAEGGKINESYPAQGTTEHVSVISNTSPKKAKLTEEQAIRKAIYSLELAEHDFAVVKEAAYNPSNSVWIVSVLADNREDIIQIQVDDKLNMGEVYTLALDEFIPIDAGLNGGMEYIAIDLSNFQDVDKYDKQLILEHFKKYDVEVMEATFDQLKTEEGRFDAEGFSLNGILLRVEKTEVSSKQISIEGSKYRSGKGAIGIKVVLKLKDSKWQVTDAHGTWIS